MSISKGNSINCGKKSTKTFPKKKAQPKGMGTRTLKQVR